MRCLYQEAGRRNVLKSRRSSDNYICRTRVSTRMKDEEEGTRHNVAVCTVVL